MDLLPELVWYLLETSGRAFLSDSRTAPRLAVVRVDVSGLVLSQSSPGHPSFERRAERARVAELWLPAAGARFSEPLRSFYDVSVNVSDRDGEDWLHELAPVLPADAPQLVAPAAVARARRQVEATSPREVLRRAVGTLRTYRQTPQVRASIARAEATLARLDGTSGT